MSQKEDLILVYDLGTTGCKVVAFTPKGRVVASHYEKLKTYQRHPTWVEQKPEEWKAAIRKGTKILLKEKKITPNQIKCISISGTQMGAVPVNDKGRPLREYTIMHFDYRSSAQAKKLIENMSGFDNFYKIHGLGHPPENLSICKVMWIKDSERKIYEDAYKFLQSKDFIALYLTQRFVTDYTDASNTGWLNIERREYSEDILEAAGIDVEKLPEIHDSHDIIGYVTKKASRETGLKMGTPVAIGAGDTPATCLGAGIIKEGVCYSYIGGANWNGVCSTKPILDPLIRMINLCHPIPGKYNVFSFTPSGGIIQDWFVDSFYRREGTAERNMYSKDSFGIMNQEISKTSLGALGLICLPYLRGGGGPHWNPNARGAFLGVSILHKRRHFLRASLEGVAFSFRWVMEQTEKAGFPVLKWRELRDVGGGAKNKYWLKIYSDVLGMKLSVLENPQEVTSLGAAIAAAVGVGFHKDYEASVKEMVRISTIILPNLKSTKIYDEIYGIYKEAFHTLTPIFEKIAHIQSHL